VKVGRGGFVGVEAASGASSAGGRGGRFGVGAFGADCTGGFARRSRGRAVLAIGTARACGGLVARRSIY
jgi:hypothetical protein